MQYNANMISTGILKEKKTKFKNMYFTSYSDNKIFCHYLSPN